MPHRYSEDEIQAVMDKLAVQDVLDRYFYGEGRLDPDIMMTCFTEDAQFGSARGKAAIRELFQGIAYFQYVYVMPTTRLITIEGDEAKSDMQAVGFVFRGDGGGTGPRGRIMAQGVRYKDTLVRTAEGWKIKYRFGTETELEGHDTFWQFDVASVPVHLD